MPAPPCSNLSGSAEKNSQKIMLRKVELVAAQAQSNHVLQGELEKKLGDLVKPLRVKDLVITKATTSTVRGVVLTECPIEKIESGKDFEVGLGQKKHAFTYVIVDGRKLLPKKIKGHPKLR